MLPQMIEWKKNSLCKEEMHLSARQRHLHKKSKDYPPFRGWREVQNCLGSMYYLQGRRIHFGKWEQLTLKIAKVIFLRFFATSCKTVTNSKVRSMNRAKRHSPEGLFKKDVGAAPKNSKICLKDQGFCNLFCFFLINCYFKSRRLADESL